MEPVLLSFHALGHDLDVVAPQVVSQSSAIRWPQRQQKGGVREFALPADSGKTLGTSPRVQQVDLSTFPVEIISVAAQFGMDASGASFSLLGEGQRVHLEAVPRQGRTRAHRALVQSQTRVTGSGFSSGVPCK